MSPDSPPTRAEMALILDFLKEFRAESRQAHQALTTKIDVMDDRIDREADVRDVLIRSAVADLSGKLAENHDALNKRVIFLEDWRKKVVYPFLAYGVLSPIISPVLVLWLKGR